MQILHKLRKKVSLSNYVTFNYEFFENRITLKKKTVKKFITIKNN